MSLQLQFEEYDLTNGLHIILHHDHSAPKVIISMMYKVGSKNDPPNRRGFAHFFEHLLFEGTKNISRGEWFKVVAENGGQNNASTDSDSTYYYEIFPSNLLALGLWMEAERMKHPVINQIGIDTQRDVIVQEYNQNYNNRAYGHLWTQIRKNIFQKHPYKNNTIGNMDELKDASLEEFTTFFNTYYTPNNAVLCVSGSFNNDEAKKLINLYFKNIQQGITPKNKFPQEKPINSIIKATYNDPQITLPSYVWAYRTPSTSVKEAVLLDSLADYLSEGKSSPLYRELIDTKKALEYSVFYQNFMDYGVFMFYIKPMTNGSKQEIKEILDNNILKIQNQLLTDYDIQKLKNNTQKKQCDYYASLSDKSYDLCRYYLFYNNNNYINTVFEEYANVDKHKIMDVAQKHLTLHKRLELDYLPND